MKRRGLGGLYDAMVGDARKETGDEFWERHLPSNGSIRMNYVFVGDRGR